LNEDGLGRHMPGNGTAGKLGSLNIPQKRQLAQRQQRAIYGQAQQQQKAGMSSVLQPQKELIGAKAYQGHQHKDYKAHLPGLASIKETTGGGSGPKPRQQPFTSLNHMRVKQVYENAFAPAALHQQNELPKNGQNNNKTKSRK